MQASRTDFLVPAIYLPRVKGSTEVGVVGSGMISKVQIIPSLETLRRYGVVSRVLISATSSRSPKELSENDVLRQCFPEFADSLFVSFPGLETDPDHVNREAYLDMYKALRPGSIVYIAVPDKYHREMIVAALEHGHHVISVKSLCTTYDDAIFIKNLGHKKGLFVGVEFHKFTDERVREVAGKWKLGQFGHAELSFASMIEDAGYLDSAFAKHFDPATSDPASYVLCHYIHQLFTFTEVLPIRLSCVPVMGNFRDDAQTPCITWTSTTICYEDGSVFTGHNGLRWPEICSERNHQGIRVHGCAENGDGTLLSHTDNDRGARYVFDPEKVASPGTLDAGSDYKRWVPVRGGNAGFDMTGYGYTAIATLIGTAMNIANIESLEDRQAALQVLDDEGFIPTPANTAWLATVYEAIRASVTQNGAWVEMDHGSHTVKLR